MKVLDVVIMGNQRLWDAFKERDRLYEVEMSDDVGMRLGELEGIIAEEDGYSADSNAEVLLAGMGIPHEYFEQKMHEIPPICNSASCSAKRSSANRKPFCSTNRPTTSTWNRSAGWRTSFMNYKGTLIVISHDRHFLNAVTTHIADIDYETIIIYPGNYDDMVVAKTSVRERAESDAKSKEKKIAQLSEFVARFGAGTRASQVQSRMREINRLQPQELKKSNIQRPYIRFIPTEKAPGKIVLKAEESPKAYDDLK